MNSKNRILNRGGFTAALICLFVSACGPNGGMDSGMMTDAGLPPGDSGPDITPDAYVPPDVDGGMPTACSRHEDCESGYFCVVQDGAGACAPSCPGFGSCGDLYPGTSCRSAPTITGGGNLDVCLLYTPPACTAAEVEARTPGCGEQYDLLTGMSYDDAAMLAECMTTLSGSWATAGESGCPVTLFREEGTNHLVLSLDCLGARDAPYWGQYRLAPDGRFLGNCGNRDLTGEAGNCGILTPTASCRTLNGEFFRGGETVPYRTQVYTHE
ncbi:hypothetical protein M0Q28_00455 [Patescibacteria group bacterium]|jgi:hypothetical protein|nr:hypothetical protein [Patescibacteria group bacterium]